LCYCNYKTALQLVPTVMYTGCRHLAESYSLLHATMAQPHKPCEGFNEEFYDNNGITNGADWYSVRGGMIHSVCTNVLLLKAVIFRELQRNRNSSLSPLLPTTNSPHHFWNALCGLRDCKNRPAPFPGCMSYKVKPGVCPLS